MLPQLNYANIEFNFFAIDGQNVSGQTNSYQILNRRQQPFNFSKAGLIAGRRGLYVIVAACNRYVNYFSYDFDLYNNGNNCTNYKAINSVIPTQNANYWDTLRVSSLALQNGNGQSIISKNQKNYFFVQVN